MARQKVIPWAYGDGPQMDCPHIVIRPGIRMIWLGPKKERFGFWYNAYRGLNCLGLGGHWNPFELRKIIYKAGI